jgi:hypothetical protein
MKDISKKDALMSLAPIFFRTEVITHVKERMVRNMESVFSVKMNKLSIWVSIEMISKKDLACKSMITILFT